MKCQISHITLVVFSAVLSLLLIQGCGLIYEYDNCTGIFTVRSDWRYAPTADPESMAYLFFSEYGHDFWRFDLPGRQQGQLVLPDGNYKLVCFNDDSSVSIVSDPQGGYNGMSVTTRPSKLYASLGGGPVSLDGQAVNSCPTQMWAQAIDRVWLAGDDLSWCYEEGGVMQYSPDRVLTVYPRAMVASYTYKITDIVNLQGVKRMSAAITGMAASLMLVDGSHSERAVTLPLKARREGDSTVVGAFHTFGLPDHTAVPNFLWLFVWLTDGRALSYKFSVTGQILDAPDPMNVDIIVGGIELPEASPSDEGAFDVSVDGWIETVIEIDS